MKAKGVIMAIEKLSKNVTLNARAIVKLKKCGNVGVITYSSVANRVATIKKLDADRYLVVNTGEIRVFERGESRIDDIASVKQSISKLRDYINTNVTDTHKCRWLTLDP